MLAKILLTLAVILGCYLFIKRQQSAAVGQGTSGVPGRRWQGPLMIGVVGMVLVGALALGLYEWHESRQWLEVRVTNTATGEVRSYQVRRHALERRRLVTRDGLEVRLSETERVEVRELEAP